MDGWQHLALWEHISVFHQKSHAFTFSEFTMAEQCSFTLTYWKFPNCIQVLIAVDAIQIYTKKFFYISRFTIILLTAIQLEEYKLAWRKKINTQEPLIKLYVCLLEIQTIPRSSLPTRLLTPKTSVKHDFLPPGF